MLASSLAKHISIREILKYQRGYFDSEVTVADGRDMGTMIFLKQSGNFLIAC